MLSVEKRGCRDILKLLSAEDVQALANTITNRNIALRDREGIDKATELQQHVVILCRMLAYIAQCNSMKCSTVEVTCEREDCAEINLGLQEAEKAIVEFSSSAGEFLRRKKISREVLAKYLLNEGVPFRAIVSKAEITYEIIKYWTSRQDREAGSPQASSQVTPPGQSSPQVALLGQSLSSTAPQQNGNLLSAPVYIQNNCILNPTVNYNVSCSVNFEGASAAISDQTQAEAFVKWFYDMLNSHNPVLNTSPKDFGPQHFWENAHLALSMISTSSERNEIVNGSIPVTAKLLSFPQDDQLIFHPNVNSDGVAMKSHPHGPRMIFVCGMLHKYNDVVGMFQQSFGLVNDPAMPESWKIRVSCLQMKEGSGFKSLRLAESSEISAIEQHTEAALHQIS